MSDLKLETYGKEIVQVTSSKFLGVYTDQHLTWVERISHISRKIVKISAYCHDSVTLQGLYNSLIFSYLSYCSISWGCYYTSRLKSLNSHQKRALHIFYMLPWFASTKPVFNAYNILCH